MRGVWSLSLVVALIGCRGSQPDGATSSPAPTPVAAHEDESGEGPPPGLEAELEALLPLTPERVLWFRVDRPGWSSRRAALYLRRDARRGAWWQAIGPSPNQHGPALWRSRWAVWVLPAGDFEGGGFRAFTGLPVWSEGAGRMQKAIELETAAGRFACQESEFTRGTARHTVWLSRGTGLVAYELQDDDVPQWRLELVEVAPRGAPEAAYRRETPDELWASVQESLRRLDPDGIERLLAPGLLRRVRLPTALEAVPGRVDPRQGPVRPPEGDLAEARLHALLSDLIACWPTCGGAWELTAAGVDGVARARARGQVQRGKRRVGCQLVLARTREGWCWEDLVVEGEDGR